MDFRWLPGSGSIPAAAEGAGVRARAAEAVAAVAQTGAALDSAIEGPLAAVPDADRALLRELCYGTLRWYWRCRSVVERLVKRPLRRRDRVIEALMTVGVYQLDQMRLPPHAVLHATVDACTALGRPGYKGLVNGVLRNFQRRRDALLDGLAEPARDAYPEWLWQAIAMQWPARARAVIEAGNGRPPMILRVNIRRQPVDEYLEMLRGAGLAGSPVAHAPDAVLLERPLPVEDLPGFEDGRVSVQDASAQLLVQLLEPEPGARILDACAAPGGKLCHILERFPQAQPCALELDPDRARQIGDNLARLQLEAEVIVADSTAPGGWWDGAPYDWLILDVPCSGTGVLRRHPDIKVLRRESDLAGFAALQARLLDRLWPLLKPGGRLLYATCSFLAEENQDQIGAFLARTPAAREEPVALPVGARLAHGWQVLPGDGGGDGFFYARLRRESK